MDWKTHYDAFSEADIPKLSANPSEWQTTLAEMIGQLAGGGSTLEAGSGFGVTSLLVGESANRAVLDLEPTALRLSRALFSRNGQKALFAAGDIFHLPFRDGAFDVVFNGGVLEHFDFAGRRAALAEMARVTRPGGKIIAAVPNHYSLPYRFSYLYLKMRNKWPYPPEERIFDFSLELQGLDNVRQLSRQTFSETSAFFFLKRLFKIFFYCLHYTFWRFEGYLTVITLEKLG